MPAASIIVAAWRAQGTIRAAVESVLAQEHDDWELVVVADDGADYRDHLTAAMRADPRIVVTTSGGLGTGPGAARNAGLARATGAFVCALDADDRFAPGRLTRLLPVAREAGLATDCVDVVDTAGATLRHAFPPGGPDRDVTADEIMGCGVPLHPLVRRDLMADGWPDLRFAEDVVLNLQLLSRAGRFPVVMTPLYAYVVHPESICHRPDAVDTAEKGYDAVLARLDAHGFGLDANILALARSGFAEKRDVNRAFGRALAEGRAASFQEFMALRDKT